MDDIQKLENEAHPGEFLWPEERKLMHHFMTLQEGAFAWDEAEKGRFREDFFPPVKMAVIQYYMGSAESKTKM